MGSFCPISPDMYGFQPCQLKHNVETDATSRPMHCKSDVNPQQSLRISKRRAYRQSTGKTEKTPANGGGVGFTSRKQHALRRPRGAGGRFLSSEELAAQSPHDVFVVEKPKASKAKTAPMPASKAGAPLFHWSSRLPERPPSRSSRLQTMAVPLDPLSDPQVEAVAQLLWEYETETNFA